MTEEIEKYLSRLKTVSVKAKEEGLSTMRVYQKIKEGYYEVREICGITFIVDKEE